jgi:hypothetical protein
MANVTHPGEMARFINVFVASVAAQALMIYFLAGRRHTWLSHNPLVVYGPFMDLVEPFVKRYYGSGCGGPSN